MYLIKFNIDIISYRYSQFDNFSSLIINIKSPEKSYLFWKLFAFENLWIEISKFPGSSYFRLQNKKKKKCGGK